MPWVALSVGLLTATGAHAFDYEIGGSLHIQGAEIPGVSRYVSPFETTSLSDQDSRVGVAGNQAEARWSADLAFGTIRGFVYGANGYYDDVLRWRSANADLQVWMKDTLTLQVPAGEYPSGATIGVSGILNGSLQSSGTDAFADATVRWAITLQRLDDYGYDKVQDSRQAANGDVVDVSEPFAPAFEVLSPGSSLATQMSVRFRFLAELQLIADTYDMFADQHLVERADIEDTLRILSVDAQPGTTWTSASGVFLPEPAVALQAAAAALALVALRRRARV